MFNLWYYKHAIIWSGSNAIVNIIGSKKYIFLCQPYVFLLNQTWSFFLSIFSVVNNSGQITNYGTWHLVSDDWFCYMNHPITPN